MKLKTLSNKKILILYALLKYSIRKTLTNIEVAELKIDGYDIFLEKNPQRGVIIYTKECLKAQEFTEFQKSNFKESSWCSFETPNNEKVLIGNIYHSPNSNIENTNKLFEILKDDSNIYTKFDKIIITGDFNFPNIKWSNDDLTGKDELFFNAIQDGYLIQHVNKPTRHRQHQQSNILDLIFTQDEADIQNIEHCSPIGKSDHEVLKVRTNIMKPKLNENDSVNYNFDKGNYNLFKKYLANIDWINIFQDSDTIQCWKLIKDIIETGVTSFIPLRKQSKNKNKKKPGWFTGPVRKSVKKKYELYKKWINSDNSHDYHVYIIERNATNKQIKKAKKEHERKIAEKSKENPKVFWNYINSQRKVKESIPALKSKDGKIYKDDYKKTCILNDFFSSVFTEEDMNNIPKMTPGEKSNNIFISEVLNITEENVSLKLKSLNPNKSPGPDKLYPKLLKELHHELSIPFTYLFKLSVKEGLLPQDWKDAEVTPIYKKGLKTDPGNYRPVSLTSIVCKLLESFIRDTIQIHMEQHKLYSTCQHGFRKKKVMHITTIRSNGRFYTFYGQKTKFRCYLSRFQKSVR